MNPTRELSCSADLKLRRERTARERSAAAFLTHPVSLSCGNTVCTQCVKGYNSLGELCPWHKHSHGFWTAVEPFEWSQLFIPCVQQNSNHVNSGHFLALNRLFLWHVLVAHGCPANSVLTDKVSQSLGSHMLQFLSQVLKHHGLGQGY